MKRRIHFYTSGFAFKKRHANIDVFPFFGPWAAAVIIYLPIVANITRKTLFKCSCNKSCFCQPWIYFGFESSSLAGPFRKFCPNATRNFKISYHVSKFYRLHMNALPVAAMNHNFVSADAEFPFQHVKHCSFDHNQACLCKHHGRLHIATSYWAILQINAISLGATCQ